MKWNKKNKKISDWIPKPNLHRKIIEAKTLKEYRKKVKQAEKQGWKKGFVYDYLRENQIDGTGGYWMVMHKPDSKTAFVNGKLVDYKW